MKFVKDYKNVQQKTITLLDKLFIISDFFATRSSIISQKKKSERSSKLIIIVDTFSASRQKSPTAVVSFSIFSNTTPISAEPSTSISIAISFQSTSTTTFSLILAGQKLAVVIFFKQVSIASKSTAIDLKPFALK